MFHWRELVIGSVFLSVSPIIRAGYSQFGVIGGRLLNNETIVNIALGLIDGCWNTYAGDAYVL